MHKNIYIFDMSGQILFTIVYDLELVISYIVISPIMLQFVFINTYDNGRAHVVE